MKCDKRFSTTPVAVAVIRSSDQALLVVTTVSNLGVALGVTEAWEGRAGKKSPEE
jgi:hypothetical protein